jgi:hypothetical protein
LSGAALLLLGVMLNLGWPSVDRGAHLRAATLQTPAAPLGQRSGMIEVPAATAVPIVFDQPKLIVELQLTGSPRRWPELISRYFAEAAARLNGFGESNIVFVEPDSDDWAGSIRVDDPAGRRWILQTHLSPHTIMANASGRFRLECEVAERLDNDRESADAEHQIDALWGTVQAEIRLQLLDAAEEFQPDLLLEHPKDD